MGTHRQAHLNQALMRIPRRAESSDRAVLAATYVQAGSFSAMLHSTDHQVLYGRRGTGKTHALAHLGEMVESSGDVVVALDLRTIGSTGGHDAAGSDDPADRGTQLLVDVLEAVHDELLTLAVDGEDALLGPLDAVAEAATAVEVVGPVERETSVGATAGSAVGLEVTMTPAVQLTAEQTLSASAHSTLRRSGVERHRVVFGPLGRALRDVGRALGGRRLWLLLDEWSSVPIELQPLLADLLRRSVLPVTGFTVKIAAIERRSRFSRPTPSGDYVGIELGADAATAVSLDDFLVFDPGRTDAQRFFGQLLCNHAGPMLRHLGGRVADAADFVGQVFRGTAFPELTRAAEGVPRDAINIAALAAQLAHQDQIDVSDVRRAARDWYLRDKQAVIETNPPARALLAALVDEVVGRRRSRTFLLERTALVEHPAVQDLCDARVVHVLRRGIADRHRPGTLYDGFAIDYGCYVGLLMDGGLPSRPRHRGGWLNWTGAVPAEDVDVAGDAIDLAALH